MKTKVITVGFALLLILSGFTGNAAAVPNASDYSQDWTISTGEIHDVEIYDGKTYYADYSSDEVQVRNSTDGSYIYRITGINQVSEMSPRSSNGVYIGNEDNGNGAIEAYDSSGNKDWEYYTDTATRYRFMETDSNGNVYWVDQGGSFGSIDSNGNIRFQDNYGSSNRWAGDISEYQDRFYYTGGTTGRIRWNNLAGTYQDYYDPTSSTIYDIDAITSNSDSVVIALDNGNVERHDTGTKSQEWSTSFSSNPQSVESGPEDAVYVMLRNGDTKILDASTGSVEGTISKSSSASWTDLAVNSDQDLATGDDNSVTYYTLPKTVSSVDISINGDSASYTTTGTDLFEATLIATYEDGSTEDVSGNLDTSYSYDTNILEAGVQSAEFKGKNSGTTNLIGTFTDDNGNSVSDSISVTVEDPAQVTSINLTGLNSEYDEGDTDNLTVIANYDDGSTKDVTSDSTYSSSNTSKMTVSSNGEINALLFGDVTITSEYTDDWFGNTVTTSSNTTILGDPSNVDLELEENQLRRPANISYTATLEYEDGRSKDITNNLDSSNLTYVNNDSQSTGLTFDYTNASISLDSTGTYNITAESNTFSDSEILTVEPSIEDYSDFEELNGNSKTFVIFSDWGFLTLFGAIALAIPVGIKTNANVAVATFTIAVTLGWVVGLVSIFIPAALMLFIVFTVIVKSQESG